MVCTFFFLECFHNNLANNAANETFERESWLILLCTSSEMPDLELADDLKKTVCLRAGGTLRLMVFVTGRPLPVVAWRKSGVELQSRGFIETTDSYTSLMVENVTRYDSGKYVVEAENPSGKKTATILVKIYGMQGKPQHF